MPSDSPFRSAAIRSLLIGYGVAASTWLLMYAAPKGTALNYGGVFTAPGLLLSGLALQVLVIILRIVIRRHVPDPRQSAQLLQLLELVADGVTVLLFALGTLGAIVQASDPDRI